MDSNPPQEHKENHHATEHQAPHVNHEHHEPKKSKFSFDSLEGPYNKHYKLLLILPVIMLLGSIIYLSVFYAQTGGFFYRDVTLTGGTTITIFDNNLTSLQLEKALQPKYEDVVVRALTDFSTGKTLAITVESQADHIELRKSVEEAVGYSLTTDNSNVEFSGSSLSDSFYKELIFAMLLAFAFMMVVVFIIFRSFLPSTYVILSALMDILGTIVIIDLIGIKISTAGVAAFLMLIGYSVDTDILLTARVLKTGEGNTNRKILGAFKTCLTLTICSIFSFSIAYFLVISPVIKQAFLILLIGLFVDLIATWFMNASLLKWSEDRKHK